MTRSEQQSEDLITSDVFGLLKYVPPNDGLEHLLQLVVRRWEQTLREFINSATYTISYSGSVEPAAQQQVFFLPLFFTLVLAIVGLPGIALRSKDSALRWQSISFDVFAALVSVGMLREATLIPASGDSLVDF